MRIIGLDPGLRQTGWGVIEVAGQKLRHIADGVCRSGTGDLAVRLARLHDALEAVIHEMQPEQAAVEHTFVNKDAAGTLKLGQARAISLLVPALHGLPVAEYAPNAVKKAVVGVGHADKTQVLHMVKLLLPGVTPEGPDSTDALAIAICHGWQAGARATQARALEAMR